MSTTAPFTDTNFAREAAIRRHRLITQPRQQFRAQLRQADLGTALGDVTNVIQHPEVWAQGWQIDRLIKSVRGIGITAVQRAAGHVLSETGEQMPEKIGDLTPDQRDALCCWLRTRYGHRAH